MRERCEWERIDVKSNYDVVPEKDLSRALRNLGRMEIVG